MKKRSLLLILMMALMVPWTVKAQQTLTVCDGTQISNRIPMYVYYFDAYARSQYIIPADSLTAMIDGNITSLHYYTSYTTNYTTDKTVTFYIKEVNYTTITSFEDPSTATMVYNGYVEFELVGDKCETTITFSAPYQYNGGNLLIGCDNDEKGSWKNISFYGASVNGAAIYGYDNSGTPTSCSSTSFIPKTTFTYEENTSDCDFPTSIAINNITHNSATVTWEGDGSAWNFRYKTTSDADYTLVEGLTDKTYTLNDIAENTTYLIGVQTVCTGSTSIFKSTSFTTRNTCEAPINLHVTDITASSATLSWDPGYQETSWTVKYKLNTVENWNEVIVNQPSIILTGLLSCKQYDVRVYTCTGASDPYLAGSFTTRTDIPFFETFDSNNIPTGWMRYTGPLSEIMAGGSLSTRDSWSFGTGSNGVFDSHTYLNIWGNSCNEWLVSPTFMMYDNVQISFDIALTQYNGTLQPINTALGADDKFVVLITTDNCASWSILRQWDNSGSEYVYNNIPCSEIGQSQSIDLSSYAGQNIAIAFYGESTVGESGSDNNIHIDNVSINYIPSCAIPTGFAKANVSGHTVDLSWASDASAWVVGYKTSTESDFTEVAVTENPYTLTGLLPETAYTVKVKADCGGVYSDWSLPINFTTDVTCPVPTNLSVDIDVATATITWNGFASSYIIDINGNEIENVTSPYVLNGEMATEYAVKVKAICGGLDGDSNWTDILNFTTDLCESNNQCEITFDLTDSYGDGWNGAYIEVTDVETGIMLAQMSNQNVAKSAETETYTLLVCNGRKIRFTWHSGDYDSECSYVVTDVNGEEIFSGSDAMSETIDYTVECTTTTCKKPSNLTALEISGHSVKLSWTENSDATAWVVAYALYGETDFTEVNANNTTFTLTGLLPETHYTVKVKPDCDVDKWSDEIDFTTDVTCPKPTNLNASDLTATSAQLSWTSGSDNNNLRWAEVTTSKDRATLEFDFEDSNMNGWTNIDADGDGYEWVLGSACGGIYLVSTGTLATEGHNGSADLVVSGSYRNVDNGNGEALTPDNYFVSPKIALGGSITFWAAAQDASYPEEHFGVAVSTTGNTDANDFTTIQEWTMTAKGTGAKTNSGTTRSGNRSQGAWYEFTVDLSAYSGLGYVAIRHFDCTDQFILLIDDITIVEGLLGTIGDWHTVLNVENPYELTGLTAESIYVFQVQANCGGDGESEWSGNKVFQTLESCPKPTGLTALEIKPTYAVLDWTVNGEESAWSIKNGETIIDIDERPYTLTGLEPETEYIVYVRADCGGEYSDWCTTPATFTTPSTCDDPYDIESTPLHSTASVNWDGYQTQYNVQWIMPEQDEILLSQDFEREMIDWQVISNNTTNGIGIINSATAVYNGTYGFVFSSFNSASDYNQYLISPQLTSIGTLQFYYKNSNSSAEVFKVGYSSTTNDLDAFTWGDEISANDNTSWALFTETIPAGTKYFAINYYSNYQYYLYIDDIAIIGDHIPAGTLQEANNVTAPYEITGLTANRMYEWQVQGICQSTTTGWTSGSFKTYPADEPIAYLDGGLWNDPDTWADDEVPAAGTNVIILSDVIIPNGYVANANNVIVEEGGSLTIEDGGQLIHNNTVTATLQRGITAYTSKDGDGWYLIASPVDNLSTSAVTTGTYDLFVYNEPNAYWYSNTGNHPFNTLSRSKGYLYANANNIDIEFTGDMIGTESNISVDLSYGCNAYPDLKGYNLLGNPFSRNLVNGDMKIGGTAVTSVLLLNNDEDYQVCNFLESGTIKPGQGFFIQATAENQKLVFNPSSKDENAIGFISIKAGDENYIDKAYIQIGEGNTLRKMTFSGNTMVYVMNEGDDYAVTTIDELTGAMPVNFKAAADGEYTITINAKNIEASTMILFDDFTGEEINLLESPTYRFKAEANDPENRFKLIFDLNNNYTGVDENYTGDIFIYQNGDEIIVNGEGELKVFDVLGRLVMNKHINGVETQNLASLPTGVYIFKLNENTQKIIIK